MRRLGLLVVLVTVLLAPAASAAEPWLQRTLAFQERLGDTLPLRDAPWLGTHNSFNTRTEVPTLSGLDANQRISMAEQLELGMRSLELDVHTFPSVFAAGAPAPVVCHARSREELDAGCTTERLLGDRLTEVRTWLDAHPRAFLLLYLEDHFDDAAGADAAAAALDGVLGDKLYKPPGGGTRCVPMPLGTSRARMRRAGAQVLTISSCASGTAWPALIWDDADRAENEAGAEEYGAYPACDPDPARDVAHYRRHVMRFFEDSTVVGATAGGGSAPLTPTVTRSLVRCGADLLGFDQLVPDDPRLAAAAWSWAPGQPSAAGCAVQRAGDARWRVAPCAKRRRMACRTRGGDWTVGGLEPYRRFKRGCAGARFAVPRTGLDAQLLRDAMRRAGAAEVFIRHRVR